MNWTCFVIFLFHFSLFGIIFLEAIRVVLEFGIMLCGEFSLQIRMVLWPPVLPVGWDVVINMVSFVKIHGQIWRQFATNMVSFVAISWPNLVPFVKNSCHNFEAICDNLWQTWCPLWQFPDTIWRQFARKLQPGQLWVGAFDAKVHDGQITTSEISQQWKDEIERQMEMEQMKKKRKKIRILLFRNFQA